jgi:hypothetical protein
MRSRASALAAVAVAAVAAGPARATVVEGEVDEFEDVTVVYVTGGGRSDRLLITPTRDGAVVRDRGGGSLTARGDCRRRARSVVSCPDASRVSVDAGAGDDEVVYTGGFAEIHGGPGDDVLRTTGGYVTVFGDRGDDRLYGGSGPDDLSGGRGRDVLHGGGGNDELAGQGPSSTHAGTHRGAGDEDDFVDGGPGRDIVTFADRRSDVTVNLRTGRAGGRGEADRLRSIESASGGLGDDRLTGDAGANHLLGSGGRDTLTGGAGDDQLDAGFKSTIFTDFGDGERDRVDCGSGRDRVEMPGLDPLPGDCELLSAENQVDLDGIHLAAQPEAGADGRPLFQAVCTGDAIRCHRRIVLLQSGRELGRSATVDVSPGLTVRIPVDVRLPLPRGVIEVRHEGEDEQEGGSAAPYLFRYRLRTGP